MSAFDISLEKVGIKEGRENNIYYMAEYRNAIRENIAASSEALMALKEFGQEYICEDYDPERVLEIFMGNLFYEERFNIIQCSLSKSTIYDNVDLTLEDLIKVQEYGVKTIDSITIPIVTNAIEKVKKFIERKKQLLDSLEEQEEEKDSKENNDDEEE